MAKSSSATDFKYFPRVSPLSSNCAHCGAAAERRGRITRQYCSDKCAAERKALIRKGLVKPHCHQCGLEFYRKSGRTKYCSCECRAKATKAYTKGYNAANLEDVRLSRRIAMRKTAKLRREQNRVDCKAWREKNKDKLNANRRTPEYRAKAALRLKERNQLPERRIRNRMHTAVYQAIRSAKAGRKWEKIVGYTLNDLTRHIERQFKKGMSWKNIGNWHIDHIVPRHMFAAEEVKDCWALSNLRPLWAIENMEKSGKRLTLL